MRSSVVLAVAVSGFAASSAHAAPAISDVAEQDRHPTATVSGADSIEIARKPDRATDGSFLEENRVDYDLLTDGEKVGGRWLWERQLDPGTYWLMATDYATYTEPVSLVIPKPTLRYRVSAARGGDTIAYTLKVTPLGEELPYRVCWPARGKRRCVRSTVAGFEWTRPGFDIVSLSVHDVSLSKRRRQAKLTWWVGGKRVATETMRFRHP